MSVRAILAAIGAAVVPLLVIAWLFMDLPAAIEPAPLSTKHAFLQGQCSSCHTPFSGIDDAQCASCHSADIRNLATKPASAFHTQAVQCTGCHSEHLGRPALAVMNHRVLTQANAFGDRAAPSDLRARLMAYLGDAGLSMAVETQAALRCASCHSVVDRHRAQFGTGCSDCHSLDTWKIAGFRHPSSTSGFCFECHLAPPSHTMMHFEMVSKTVSRQPHAQLEQCGVCHQTDSWNNIRGVGYYKHH